MNAMNSTAPSGNGAPAPAQAAGVADPITLEVIHNRLESISREMSNITLRTARSSVVHSGRDFSCALFDSRGQLLTIGTSIPPHIMPMLVGMQSALKQYQDDIAPGDIFIGNDPYDGGTHLNDVAVFIPMFHQGTLMGFAGNRAHWPDVGGSVPGSISGSATEIFQEGLRMPPMRIGRNDRLDPDMLRFISANVRLPQDIIGDLKGQLASCRIALQRVTEMADVYGAAVVQQTFDEILDVTEKRMRARIAALPASTVTHEGYMDNDGTVPEPVRLRASITVEGDGLVVDYTGTAPQSAGCLNTTLGVTEGFAFMAIKAALDPKGPINSGSMRPIRVVAPRGTCLNAIPPAACGGLGELGQAMIFTMVAMGKLVPDQITAEEPSSINHQNLDGIDTRPDRGRFVFYDAVSGGCGARSTKDGLDFVRTIRSGNYTMMSSEVLENLFPIVFEKQQLRRDSGGAGKFRGGVGLEREYRVLTDTTISVLGDHGFIPAAGLAEGQRGSPTRWHVKRHDNGEVEPVSPKFRTKGALGVRAGDVVRLLTPSGGGWGAACERDVARVLDDVLDEKVSLDQARDLYGVVIDPRSMTVDEKATAASRDALRAARKTTSIERGGELAFKAGMRVGWAASASGWPADSRVEIFTDTRPHPLILRIVIDETVPQGSMRIDAQAWDELGLSATDRPQALVRDVVDIWP